MAGLSAGRVGADSLELLEVLEDLLNHVLAAGGLGKPTMS